jgi:uroporphyrinogen-III synthase
MRVLLTRAAEDAARSARLLEKIGFESVVAPVIETRDGVESPPEGVFDGLIVTSAKAASRLWRFDAELRALPVFAVGPRTARAIGSHGIRDVFCSAGDAKSLIRDIPTILPPPARLLHIAGRDRKEEPAHSLREMGYEVSLWTAYVAAAVEELPEAARRALADGAIDAALHYSPRSAKLALELVDGAGLRDAFAGLRHVAISADVAAVLREGGCERVGHATKSNEKAMFRVLLEMCADQEARQEGRFDEETPKQSP